MLRHSCRLSRCVTTNSLGPGQVYEFRLEDRIPENHLLGRMNVFVTVALADLRAQALLQRHRPGSVDPELMIRMLIVGYCYGIRSERKLCQEVELHLA
jgi:transposase